MTQNPAKTKMGTDVMAHNITASTWMYTSKSYQVEKWTSSTDQEFYGTDTEKILDFSNRIDF